MPINQEGGYEDSYQKEERLKTEYVSILKEIEDFIRVSQEDSGKINDSFERYNSVDKRINELKEEERQLEEELKKLEIEFANLPEEDKSRVALEGRIDSTRDKILEIGNEISSLREELIKIIEEETGLKGDYEETESVLQLKWQKLDEVRHQLEEFDE